MFIAGMNFGPTVIHFVVGFIKIITAPWWHGGQGRSVAGANGEMQFAGFKAINNIIEILAS